MDRTRDQGLLDMVTFVTDTLVDHFEVVEFLHEVVERCADLYDAAGVNLTLAGPQGDLVVMASTSKPRSGTPEHIASDGPGIDSFISGEVVTAETPEEIRQRWPAFAIRVEDSGVQSVHAAPLRLRQSVIGSLCLLRDQPGTLDPVDAQMARAIADLATIGLIHERTWREGNTARAELQHALDARIIIEQAKGVISHSRGVEIDAAWTLLQEQARSQQIHVADAARNIIKEHTRR